ncbi:CBR-PQN-47 protein [Aphelenchoides avenae]|nr:CBR-PQN-47 protein [Aphelenchus avenae]
MCRVLQLRFSYSFLSGPPVKLNTAVEITNMGARLDERYCLKDSCNPRRGHFDLFVPVSPHMPVIPLFLKIKSDGDKRIESCGSLLFVAHETCNKATAYDPDVIRIDDGLFELSVGNFAQAGYRFRVGFGSDLCGRPDSERGRSFDEFNTIFYRKCAAE